MIDFSQHNRIIDTEISSYNPQKGYFVTISFWKNEEISFYCRHVNVNIPKETVQYYTDNIRKQFLIVNIVRISYYLLKRYLITYQTKGNKTRL